MKNLKVYYIFVYLLFILAAMRTDVQAQQNYILGIVRAIHNNQPVSGGVVKAYNVNGVLIETAPIQTDGSYCLSNVPSIELDLIGVANHEWEDYIPTHYPNAVDWQNGVRVTPNGTMSGVDIYVEVVQGGGYPFTLSVSGTVTSNNEPLSNAMIFIQSGENYFGYCMSDSKGRYEISSVPEGDFILVAQRVGSNTVRRSISLNSKNLENINFNLSPNSPVVSSSIKNHKLSQNYPNPFNPSTTIRYDIPNSGNVKISVFNSIGQLVKELVNGYQEAGNNEVVFNASGLSSGIYYYRLEAGSFTEIKKMILVK